MKINRFFKIIYYPFKRFFHRLNNKRLIKKYPFLLRDDYCWLDSIPLAWRKKFGISLCNDISFECKRNGIHPKEVSFIDIKCKWGVLTIDYAAPIDLDDIMQYYEDLSMLYCMNCGKITKYATKGWVSYICNDCAKKYYKNRDLDLLTTLAYVPKRIRYNTDGQGTTVISSNVPFEKYWPETRNQ